MSYAKWNTRVLQGSCATLRIQLTVFNKLVHNSFILFLSGFAPYSDSKSELSLDKVVFNQVIPSLFMQLNFFLYT